MQSRKYNRTYHFPFSPGTTSDDRILKDWTSLLEREIVITEKLDGENNCLKKSGVYARSHAAPTRSPWARNTRELWSSIKNDLGDLEIFGENLYGVHSIEYTRLEHYFYVFAIRDGERWLAWDELEFYAKVLDLPCVPVIERGKFTKEEIQTIIRETMEKGSVLGGECEGLVCRDADGFSIDDFTYRVLKYVRKNHVKTDEHWTRNWHRAKLWFEMSTQ